MKNKVYSTLRSKLSCILIYITETLTYYAKRLVSDDDSITFILQVDRHDVKLVDAVMNCGFHKIQGISGVVKEVLLKTDSAPGSWLVGLLGS